MASPPREYSAEVKKLVHEATLALLDAWPQHTKIEIENELIDTFVQLLEAENEKNSFFSSKYIEHRPFIIDLYERMHDFHVKDCKKYSKQDKDNLSSQVLTILRFFASTYYTEDVGISCELHIDLVKYLLLPEFLPHEFFEKYPSLETWKEDVIKNPKPLPVVRPGEETHLLKSATIGTCSAFRWALRSVQDRVLFDNREAFIALFHVTCKLLDELAKKERDPRTLVEEKRQLICHSLPLVLRLHEKGDQEIETVYFNSFEEFPTSFHKSSCYLFFSKLTKSKERKDELIELAYQVMEIEKKILAKTTLTSHELEILCSFSQILKQKNQEDPVIKRNLNLMIEYTVSLRKRALSECPDFTILKFHCAEMIWSLDKSEFAKEILLEVKIELNTFAQSLTDLKKRFHAFLATNSITLFDPQTATKV